MIGDGAPPWVHFGCGFTPAEGWLNYDASPALRLERVPVMGPWLGRLAAAARQRPYQPFPSLVRYGDVVRGLPVADGGAGLVFSSHVLEHLALADAGRAVREVWRVLRPGGIFRLVVPDLERRARRYIAALDAGAPGDRVAAETFLRSAILGMEDRPRGGRAVVSALTAGFGGSAHLWMWDAAALGGLLHDAGFIGIRRCRIGDARHRAFDAVERADRFADEDGGEELAMEAVKPSDTIGERS